MQMIFTRSRDRAPNAGNSCPDPRSRPNATRGGSKATATITPMRIVETTVVNARTPALPEANAMTIEDWA